MCFVFGAAFGRRSLFFLVSMTHRVTLHLLRLLAVVPFRNVAIVVVVVLMWQSVLLLFAIKLLVCFGVLPISHCGHPLTLGKLVIL